ncbi:ribonuclease H-like domain-containing protein [Massariosphaeria phaeospora]|uniref:Ribonuclease H-like domain-containing protein n=1 Tax=Massariosphaeria phaeospora TaxID=100035 RepID=A0A7C8MNJ8_9PLEO|nr:ribonuclease H-like domain-containing protein [Massariosphaeria phaeospora]
MAATIALASESDAATSAVDPPRRPLSFKLKSDAGTHWYGYYLYRGPEEKKVQVLYSQSLGRSEAIAKQFLNEAVVGFDMEWKSMKPSTVQEHVSLIQVACEDKIGLFHIALHRGKVLLAPSLRKLIESPNIVKAGVAILSADCSRLSKHFGLKPQAIFELSHLYRLVTHGTEDLRDAVDRRERLKELTTKLVALAKQVEHYLGFPLAKGNVRMSDWSKELDWKQKSYAATDAYAGFMLYHRMNALRQQMEPVPPLPLLEDQYMSLKWGESAPQPVKSALRPIRLEFPTKAKGYITVDEFYQPNIEPEGEVVDDAAVETDRGVVRVRKQQAQKEVLDKTTQALYDHLVLRRKLLAGDHRVLQYKIATNAVLKGLAQQRPLHDDELLLVKGIGERQRDKFGAEWLEVIALYLANNEPANNERIAEHLPEAAPKTPSRRAARPIDSLLESSPPAFGSPLPHIPTLHTGLSFKLADTLLDPGAENHDSQSSPASETSSAFVTALSTPRSDLKRKRPESPLPQATPTPVPAPNKPPPPSPRQMYKKKLQAFSRLVTKQLPQTPKQPIVSDWALDQIVATCPRTMGELSKVPGIHMFQRACKDADMDLLKNVIKFAPARSP